jgi:hypothetical protein
MKHYTFNPFTNIKIGDLLFWRDRWQEIWYISDDDGLLLNGSWISSDQIYYDSIQPSFEI